MESDEGDFYREIAALGDEMGDPEMSAIARQRAGISPHPEFDANTTSLLDKIGVFDPETVKTAVDRIEEEEKTVTKPPRRRKEKIDPLPPEGKPYLYTDTGVAELIHDLHGENWFYRTDRNDWYFWNGKYWELDTTLEFSSLISSVLQQRLLDMIHTGNDTARTFYNKCLNAPSIRHIEEANRRFFAIPPEWIDGKTEYLTVNNGVYNLKTHQFTEEFNRELFTTKRVVVDYNTDADCPLWKKHMNMVFERNTELIEFFQELCGYTLLPFNPAEVFFILWGAGLNGKTQTCLTISMILGEYSKIAQVDTIMKKRPTEGSSHRADLIHIADARMIQIAEGNEDDEIAAGLIKQITGGDGISARGAYEKRQRDYKIGGKIWFVTNHLPHIDGADFALMRRIYLIPFNARIKDDEKIENYAERLFENEGSGILTWMLEGLKRYQNRGRFVIPAVVMQAINQYKTSNDILREWLYDECVLAPDGEETRSVILGSYKNHCEYNGVKPLSPQKFWKTLEKKGVNTNAYVNRLRGCRGIRLMKEREKAAFWEQASAEGST